MLYKEIIERKKLPVMTSLILLLCIFIYLSKLVSSLFMGEYKGMIEILNAVFPVLMLVIIVGEVYKSNIRYKYSVIADQLIIHKLIRNSMIEVQNIKLKDIKFIGNQRELGSKYKIACSRKYLCSLFNSNRYCCVYSDGKVFKKFYFEPSKEMISRLKLMMNKDEECVYVKSRLSISI